MKNIIKNWALMAGLGTTALEGKAMADVKPPVPIVDTVKKDSAAPIQPEAKSSPAVSPLKEEIIQEQKAQAWPEHPFMKNIDQRIDNLKFSEQYSPEEREEIKDFLRIRMKIMRRLKFLLETDNSGTDKRALKMAYDGRLNVFNMSMESIEAKLAGDPKSTHKFIMSESIPDDDVAINMEAARIRSVFIESARGEASQTTTDTESE